MTMKHAKRSIALLLVLAACSKPSSEASSGGAPAKPAPSAPVAPAPPAAGKPIRARLAADAAGKPVLLALDPAGQLIARTADGSFTRVLLAGPYGDAAPDPERDLVWLRGDDQLDVLDLRGAALTATTVIRFPSHAMEKLGQHITEPVSWTMESFVNVMLSTPCGAGAGLRLPWANDGEGTAAWAQGFRAVAKDWFAAEARRDKHAVAPAAYSTAPQKHKVPRGAGTCRTDAKEEYGASRCGQSLPLGATGAELMIVSASADHCPATRCQLYDPRTKQLSPIPGLDPGDDRAPTCGPFRFDPSGTSFLVADQVCGADLTCSSVGHLAIGWLAGDHELDLQ